MQKALKTPALKQNPCKSVLICGNKLSAKSAQSASKNRVHLCNLWPKVAYTGCPITILILQNEPNFRSFWLENKDLAKKRTQTNPNLPAEASAKAGLYRLGNLGCL